MKRDALKALGIADDAIDRIMDMNGEDINKAKASGAEIQSKLDTANASIAEMQKKLDGYKDFDTIKSERDTLLAEKNKRAVDDRFTAVLGKNEPANDITREGLLSRFTEEIGKPENKDKSDADIFKSLVDGKENYFAGKFSVDMTPQGSGRTEKDDYIAKYGVKTF